MALSEAEKQQLKQLQDKAKEPDRPAPSVNFSLDLGNDAAYERAIKLGIIQEPDSNGDGDGDGDGDGEGEEAPTRRGYFG